MTKMSLYGHKGLELLREGILVFRLVRDELKGALYLVDLVEKRYRLKRKKERREKKREGKLKGFVQERFVALPTIFLHFSWSQAQWRARVG